jgi:GNAT superfamily N-acetyltransferase
MEHEVSVRTQNLWRPANSGDIADIVAIAADVHPELPERIAVLEEKRALFPAGCYCLEDDGLVTGYALSHPWLLYDVPPLDRFLGALPAHADCLYVHDVAIHAAARGKGAARALIQKLDHLAREVGLPSLALTSVNRSRQLWERLGFAAVSDKRIGIDSYGGSAIYMVRHPLQPIEGAEIIPGSPAVSANRSQSQ